MPSRILHSLLSPEIDLGVSGIDIRFTFVSYTSSSFRSTAALSACSCPEIFESLEAPPVSDQQRARVKSTCFGITSMNIAPNGDPTRLLPGASMTAPLMPPSAA
ncbi:hypothetical protein CEXT_305801 [Caerostris extrusa]|uniref:Uncharacterized protein n=1 Tax=Caerostris extrusa TaxID=172846 RepID=A0AAV4XY53_CAEEX|nr:hypothetical protein CEXT_305801 [Caerostris extrusa]